MNEKFDKNIEEYGIIDIYGINLSGAKKDIDIIIEVIKTTEEIIIDENNKHKNSQ
jgi:hypothetical protein